MAGDISQKYGTEAQAITITLNSLGSTNARESTAVDNTTNLFQEVLIQVKITSASASTSSSGLVNVYAYGTTDATTPIYPDTVTGSDAAITLTSPTNLRLIGQLNVVVNSTIYKSMPFSLAAAFGGVVPEKWGIVVQNLSGAALPSSGHGAIYQGIKSQYT